MAEIANGNVGSPPPHTQLIQMGMGYIPARILYIAAKMGLADLLADEPKSAAELAGPTGTHERSLHRLMRTLSSLGILTEGTAGRFGLTEMGEALKTGVPGSARASILTFGGWAWNAFGEMGYSVETGNSAFTKVYGMPPFQWMMSQPEEAALFGETMIGFHGAEPPAVAEAYDFSGFGTVVDVGGSTGNLLVHILGRCAGPRGVLFDLPVTLAEAPAFLRKHGMEERIAIEPGSFFENVPAWADCYILSHVIHDWSEEQDLTILGHCRRVMKPQSKLLIVEFVLPSDNSPHPGKFLDMVMLTVTGGEERTAEEYGALLAKAGLRMTHVVPTSSAASIVEAVVA
jgi:O-methyltransferase domain/Dimerisation domain